MAAGVGLLTKALLPARVILVALFAMPIVIGGAPAPSWPPAALRDTGLYSDWATKTIARDNLPFSPQYPLWSDGATKERYMAIPGAGKIEFETVTYPQPAPGSVPGWRFPDGTVMVKMECEAGSAAADITYSIFARTVAKRERDSSSKASGDSRKYR